MAGLEELQYDQTQMPEIMKMIMSPNTVVSQAYDYIERQKNNELKMRMNQLAAERQAATQQADINVGLLAGKRAEVGMEQPMLDAYRDTYTSQAGLQKNALEKSSAELPNVLSEEERKAALEKLRKAALENPTPETLAAVSKYVSILNATDPAYQQALGKTEAMTNAREAAKGAYKPLPFNVVSKESSLTGKTIDQIYEEDYAAWQMNRPRVAQSLGTQPTTTQTVTTPSQTVEQEKRFSYSDASPEEQQQMDALIAKKDYAGVNSLLNALSQKYKNSLGDYQVDNTSILNQVVEHKAPKANSAREARYADVVAIAGNEAQAAIKNLVNMPVTASSGWFGPDVKLGNGLFEAPVQALKKTLSKEYTNSYNAEVDNIGAFYARLINGGLSVSQADINKFTDQYRIKQGEDAMTAMTRFAQMRQAFERAAEVKLASKATPPEQMAMWEDAVKMVKEVIPVTVNDINELRNQKNPTKTFGQMMGETKSKLTTPEDFNVKWATLKPGETLVGPDGKTYKKGAK
jgi:hypothetical protein